ncbi:MAG: SLATT domain-containing protein, partial [Actinobacteria bacterium]
MGGGERRRARLHPDHGGRVHPFARAARLPSTRRRRDRGRAGELNESAAETAPVGLADDDLPAAFRAADRTAIASQARTMRWLGWQLALLVLAAIFGVIPGDIGDLRVGPLLALVVFAVAVILSWRVASEA